MLQNSMKLKYNKDKGEIIVTNTEKYLNILFEAGVLVEKRKVVGEDTMWHITGKTLNKIGSIIEDDVIIPDYVAEFIEDLKEKGATLHQATDLDNMYVQTNHPKIFKWQSNKPAEKQEIIAKAWLNGYYNEKEYICVAKLSLDKVLDEHEDDVEYFFNTNRILATNKVWISDKPMALPMDEWIDRGITDDIAEFYEIEV